MGELRVLIDDELHRSLKQKALVDQKTLKQLVIDTLKKEVEK